MQLFNWWNVPRKAWIIILTELSIIIFLGSALYSEYVNSQYFQTYVNTSVIPIAVPVLSVIFGITSASIATFLYFGMRRVQQANRGDEPPQKRRLHRKVKRTRSIGSSRSSEPNMNSGVPKPRFVITNSNPSKETVEKATSGTSIEKKEK